MKVRFLILVLSVILFSSCSASKYTLSKEDAIWELNNKLLVIRDTPDSLRSAEDEILQRKVNFIGIEKITMGNDLKQELTISRKEIKKMGLPNLLYDMLKEGIDRVNKALDEYPMKPEQLRMCLESYREAVEAYWEQKRLNPEEYEW